MTAAYVYRAALWCERCVQSICGGLAFPTYANPNDETTWDSDDYPKGPYPNGGEEADTPQHCDGCGKFLKNPLTDDGRAYVREALANHVNAGSGLKMVLDQWSHFYDIPWPDREGLP